LSQPQTKSQKASRAARASDLRSLIEDRCREKGIVLTGPRHCIAQTLLDAADHPDVVELHRRVTQLRPRVSLSTVYRTMKLLESLGIVECHKFRDGRMRYELTPTRHHDHLIDVRTGKVIEFRSDEIERLQADIASRFGYRLVGHRLELYATPIAGQRRRA
jgi:Fur family transcriptional regulator, ferric uptake regulator